MNQYAGQVHQKTIEAGLVYVQVAEGKSWGSLPEDFRQRICIELLEQPADGAWLPVLEAMHKQESDELRLTTVCAKALCDHREFERAYAVCRGSLITCTNRFFSGDPEKAAKGIRQHFSDIRILGTIKRHIDILHRRDVMPRYSSNEELERTFEAARDVCKSMLPALSSKTKGELLSVLIELAEYIDRESFILDVAEMFVQSSAKYNIIAYADFMRRLQGWPNPKHDKRLQLIRQFRDEVDRLTSTERAFLKLLRKQTGCRLEKWMDGTESEAVNLVSQAVSFADRIFASTAMPLVRKTAEQLLQRLTDPRLKLGFAAHLARFRDKTLRDLAAKTLREYASRDALEPDEVNILVEPLLDLNETQLLRDLHARGVFDKGQVIPLYRMNTLYATMGLFSEGAENLKQARHQEIANFSETGAADSFYTAMTLMDEIHEFEFLQKCNAILNSVPQPKEPRGILVVAAKGPHELNQYPILSMTELKRRGYAIVPLAAGVIDYQPTGVPEIDDIANHFDLGLDMVRSELNTLQDPLAVSGSRRLFPWKFSERNKDTKENWVWDPDNHELSYLGINAYWGIREDICCLERRYTVDFTLPRYQDYLAYIRRRIENWERLLRNIAAVGKKRGIPVRFILQYVHLSTHYYCRMFTEAASAQQDISVIHSGIAYENYFQNFVKESSTTLAVFDVTKLRNLAASSYPPDSWFLHHYKHLSDEERDRIVEVVERETKQNRVRRTANADVRERAQFFKTERDRGRRIVALFGKVLFDQGLPRGDGVVHRDMRDWFDHSIEIARRNPGIHLVIKPHPHELRDEIALYSSEVLKDWLPNPPPDNVHFLDNDEFNLYELAEFLDLALVWTGMSAVELGVQRVPTILGAYYGVINFPVGHLVPTSRPDFERLMVGYSRSELPDEVRRMSAVYIDYLRHPEVSVPYRYTHRGLTNKHIALGWFDEDLQAYEVNGDRYVEVLADRLDGRAYTGRS